MTLEDFTYCLRLTTASNLLRNHCYAALLPLGLIPKLDIPITADKQGGNTKKLCGQSGDMAPMYADLLTPRLFALIL